MLVFIGLAVHLTNNSTHSLVGVGIDYLSISIVAAPAQVDAGKVPKSLALSGEKREVGKVIGSCLTHFVVRRMRTEREYYQSTKFFIIYNA